MSKIINNKIKYGLGILAIFTLGMLAFSGATAEAKDRTGYYREYSEEYVNTDYNYSPSYSTPYNPNPGVFTNGVAVSTAVTKVVTKPLIEIPPTDYKEVKEEFSDVTANALYGANSFFPSSLMGWLLFAILVLIIIILARKFMGLEKKYHSTPLKHA